MINLTCAFFRAQMQLFFIALTSIIWGVTNPFIRKASSGIEKVKEKQFFKRVLLEFKVLFTNISVTSLINHFN